MITASLDKKKIARSFGLKARNYCAYSDFQIKSLEILHGLIKDMRFSHSHPWIDLGSGPGLFRAKVQSIASGVDCVCLDLAFDALCVLKKQATGTVAAVQADIENLPLKTERFAVAVMASTLQWITDQAGAIRAVHGLLVPRGHFLFAVFLEDAFTEINTLRARWGLSQTIRLISKEMLDTMIASAGLRILNSQEVREKEYYPSAWDALKKISGIGGCACLGPRMPRRKVFDFCREYEQSFRAEKGVPLTYHAVIGVARKNAKKCFL
ncbi:MAG: methyltransferase domain-containing protein [Chitinivibrionales bacterium]|nr:methyltransferase domain-containing protein [Chitinivibrionales bacterium]